MLLCWQESVFIYAFVLIVYLSQIKKCARFAKLEEVLTEFASANMHRTVNSRLFFSGTISSKSTLFEIVLPISTNDGI